MTNKVSFKEAIASGIRDGLRGSDERKSIREIALSFGRELSSELKSTMKVDTTIRFHEPSKQPKGIGELMARGIEIPTTSAESSSLSACVKGGSDWFELFRLDMNPKTGYPCAIEYDESRYPCSNALELRTELERLIQERGTYIVENVGKRAKRG